MFKHLSRFDRLLSVSAEEVEIELRGPGKISWADFILNPRRLRGSDFLMRWSQGVWSEKRLIQAVNESDQFFALPFGPSGTAPKEDVREFELYFERLEQAGLGKLKRPDLLIFAKDDENAVKAAVEKLGGVSELPFIPDKNEQLRHIVSHAALAVECENSLWKAGQMPNYGVALTPQKRLGGKPGLKKSAVLPTVIIKEEDRVPLQRWQDQWSKPIHIWHVFYDLAFGIAFDEVERVIANGLIEPTKQVFQAPGGATTQKIIYKVYYNYAYRLGDSSEEPQLVADCITDKNGHILPYVRFEGGKLKLSADAFKVLSEFTRK
ncbi:MAG: type II restriction endonuclease [Deltaproteobacteria bacterium RBG_13_61_14]|nr:MAG: type II restriction endonuclease [Deltaproteobacteria bacterium RBG_13_61_14]